MEIVIVNVVFLHLYPIKAGNISKEDGGIQMVVSVKFTILISWSPICIPLILLSASMRLASTSAAVLYNNLDS